MGKEFIGTTCEIKDIQKSTFFNGCTIHNKKFENQAPNIIFLNENEASNALCNALDNYVAGYTVFSTENVAKFANAKVKQLEAQVIKKAHTWWAYMADVSDKAAKMKSRTCASCGKVNDMSQAVRLHNHYSKSPINWLHAYGVSTGCSHCGDKAMPLTKAQYDKGEKLRGEMADTKTKMHNALQAELNKQYKAGKVKTQATLGAWVHDSEARRYDEDYDEDEYDDF